MAVVRMSYPLRISGRRQSGSRSDYPLIRSAISTFPPSWACSMSRPIRFPTAAASDVAARRHALRMVEEGAGLIDVGGESTRPGAQAVGAEEEIRRVVPVIEALAARTTSPDLGRHQQARGHARRGARRREHDQRRARAARAGRARGCSRTRGGDLPDAHAGRAANHAGRSALRRRRRGSARLPARARGRHAWRAASRRIAW